MTYLGYITTVLTKMYAFDPVALTAATLDTTGIGYGLAVRPQNDTIYTTGTPLTTSSQKLQVFDVATFTQTGTFDLGIPCRGLNPVISPDGAYLYIPAAGAIIKWATATNTAVGLYSPGLVIGGLAIDPTGASLYAVTATNTTRNLVVLSTTTMMVTQSTAIDTLDSPLGNGITPVLVSMSGATVYVGANLVTSTTSALVAYDAASLAEVSRVTFNPTQSFRGMVESTDSTKLYVSQSAGIRRYTARTLVGGSTIIAFRPLGLIDVSTDGLYVFSPFSSLHMADQITVSSDTATGFVAAGSTPVGVAFAHPGAVVPIVSPPSSCNWSRSPACIDTSVQSGQPAKTWAVAGKSPGSWS